MQSQSSFPGRDLGRCRFENSLMVELVCVLLGIAQTNADLPAWFRPTAVRIHARASPIAIFQNKHSVAA